MQTNGAKREKEKANEMKAGESKKHPKLILQYQGI